MRRPAILQAFTEKEFLRAYVLLASKIATMMGRKLEEGDWSQVYCGAKGIPSQGWSNLKIDVVDGALGIEHKMLRVQAADIRQVCGTSPMHPAATRSIRIPDEKDPTKAARDIIGQYAALIRQRAEMVKKNAGGQEPDMRTGWLLWQDALRQFLYFEEEMLPPDPGDYTAEWKESGTEGGLRKTSRNLWVFETETGRKRYSITTSAGAKIQPYFDVPPPTEKNLYLFTVQGEVLENGMVRLWITRSTARIIERALGHLNGETISAAILEIANAQPPIPTAPQRIEDTAVEILITQDAYAALQNNFAGLSDEHMAQLFAEYLQGRSAD